MLLQTYGLIVILQAMEMKMLHQYAELVNSFAYKLDTTGKDIYAKNVEKILVIIACVYWFQNHALTE